MEAVPYPDRRIRTRLPVIVKQVLKLYGLGLLLSFLAALLGLMSFLGDWVPLPGRGPFLPGRLVERPPGPPAEEGELQDGRAPSAS